VKKNKLMVIAAHCDDVEFNFGSTMLKYHEQFGYEIIYVQSTNNMSGGWAEAVEGERAATAPKVPAWVTDIQSHASGRCISHQVPWYIEMAQRKLEAANAARKFFHTEPIHLDYAQRHYWDRKLNKIDLRYGSPLPDCLDPEIPTIMTACDDRKAINRVADLILEKDPEVILTHAAVDYTFEHTGTTLLVKKAFTKAQEKGYDGSLLCALAPVSIELGKFFDRWDSFVETTGYLAKKREAIGMHACQVPYPDVLDLMDAVRGKICGFGEIEPYTVVELSETRRGPLTEELIKNHNFCNANWMKLFFSPETESILAAFQDEFNRKNGIAPRKTAKRAAAP
jgi:LmbE family N-acetylglucosaminyl deacetylase